MQAHKINFFMRGLAGSNSEFFFIKTGCKAEVKYPSLPYNLPIFCWIHTFQKSMIAMWIANSLILDRIIVPIPNNGNYYTIYIYIYIYIYMCVCVCVCVSACVCDNIKNSCNLLQYVS